MISLSLVISFFASSSIYGFYIKDLFKEEQEIEYDKITNQNIQLTPGGIQVSFQPFPCGDNICDPGETPTNCPQDCAPPILNLVNPSNINNNLNNVVQLLGINFIFLPIVLINGVSYSPFWTSFSNWPAIDIFVPQGTPTGTYNIQIQNPSGLISNTLPINIFQPPIVSSCGDNICNQNEFFNICQTDCTLGNLNSFNLRQGSFPRIVIKNNYAYLIKGESSRGFAVMDINKPLNQIDIDAELHLTGAQFHRNLDVYNDKVYVIDDNAGLFIINIINPLNPVEINNWGLSGSNSIKIIPYNNGQQLFAYIGMFGNDGVVANVTDQNDVNISFSSFKNVALNNFNLGPFNTLANLGLISVPTDAAFSLSVNNNKLYVANGYTGIRIFDITTPVPQPLGYYDANSNVLDVYGDGNYVYLATLERGLLKVDISNPSNPQQIGQYLSNMFFTRGVNGDANYIYVAGAEVTTPYNITLLWNILSSNLLLYSVLQNISQVSSAFNQVAEHYVKEQFIKSWANPANLLSVKDTLKVLDKNTLNVVKEYIHSPSVPSSSTPYFLIRPSQPFSYPIVKNGTAFVPDRNFGIRILNISSNTPTLEKDIFIYGEIIDSKVIGNKLFINYASVVDISNPLNPVILKYFETNLNFPNYHVVAGIGNTLYLNGIKQTKIFDVTTPNNPVEIGEIILDPSDPSTIYSPRNIDLYGNNLYSLFTKAGTSHLGIYNLNNPFNPQLIPGSLLNLNIPGSSDKPSGLFYVSDGLAFILQPSALYIINVTNPSNTFIAGNIISNCIISPIYPGYPGACPYNNLNPNPIQGSYNPMLRIGNLLFIGSGKYDELPGVPAENIVVINISNPQNPAKITSLNNLVMTPWGNVMVTDFHPLSNNLLIATDVTLGIFIIDFSNISNLRIKAQQPYTEGPDVYDAGYLDLNQKIFGNVRNDKIRLLNLSNIVLY